MSVSVVLNSWKRQVNLPSIVQSLHSSSLVTDIWIWDNNPDIYLDPKQFPQDKVRVVNSSVDFGLVTRWTLGLFAKNDCIITQDDDFLVGPEQIKHIYKAWCDAPDVMHGISGRTVKPDGTYYANWIHEGKAPIIATGFAAVHKKHCLEFPKAFDRVKRELGDYITNSVVTAGDDMLMSYLALSMSHKPNLVHKIPYTELKGTTDPMLGIHTRKGFWEKRTAMVRAFQKLFDLDSQDYA